MTTPIIQAEGPDGLIQFLGAALDAGADEAFTDYLWSRVEKGWGLAAAFEAAAVKRPTECGAWCAWTLEAVGGLSRGAIAAIQSAQAAVNGGAAN